MTEEKTIGIAGSAQNGNDAMDETIMALTTVLQKEGKEVMIAELGKETMGTEVGRLGVNMTLDIEPVTDLQDHGILLTVIIGGDLVLHRLPHVVLVLIVLHMIIVVDKLPPQCLTALHQVIRVNHRLHIG